MIRRGAEPDVHLGARIEIEIGETQQAGFVIEGPGDPLDEGGKVQSDYVQPDPNGLEVLL